MASTIILRHSATSGSSPSNGTLASGEIAVNTADKIFYIGGPTGTTETLFTGLTGTGNITFVNSPGQTALTADSGTTIALIPGTGGNIQIQGRQWFRTVAGVGFLSTGVDNNAGLARDDVNRSLRVVGDASTSSNGSARLTDFGFYASASPTSPGAWTSKTTIDMGGNVITSGTITSTGNVTTSGQFVGTGSIASISTTAPATAGSAGVKGTIAYDSSYIYICVATNTWIRAARSAF
jgi:hypothetical protein